MAVNGIRHPPWAGPSMSRMFTGKCAGQFFPTSTSLRWFLLQGFTFCFLREEVRSLSEGSGPVLVHWLLLEVLLQLLGLLLECLHQDLKFFIYFKEIKAGVLFPQGSGLNWLGILTKNTNVLKATGVFSTSLELGRYQYLLKESCYLPR